MMAHCGPRKSELLKGYSGISPFPLHPEDLKKGRKSEVEVEADVSNKSRTPALRAASARPDPTCEWQMLGPRCLKDYRIVSVSGIR